MTTTVCCRVLRVLLAAVTLIVVAVAVVIVATREKPAQMTVLISSGILDAQPGKLAPVRLRPSVSPGGLIRRDGGQMVLVNDGPGPVTIATTVHGVMRAATLTVAELRSRNGRRELVELSRTRGVPPQPLVGAPIAPGETRTLRVTVTALGRRADLQDLGLSFQVTALADAPARRPSARAAG